MVTSLHLTYTNVSGLFQTFERTACSFYCLKCVYNAFIQYYGMYYI